MFPFQQGNQWMSQISSDNPSHDYNCDYDSQLQNLFSADEHLSLPEERSDVNDIKLEETHQQMAENVDSEERKIMHRDVERERRKQMAYLLTNLRSLLPLEFMKGKRSKADLLNEAVHFIKHLRGKIGELHTKRDTLKRLSHMSISGSQNENFNLCSSPCVVVNPHSSGLEIVISGCFREEGLKLSRVMQVLLQENVDVDSCASTIVNERSFHTIQSNVVVDSMRIDLSELQQKLYEAACNSGPYGA